MNRLAIICFSGLLTFVGQSYLRMSNLGGGGLLHQANFDTANIANAKFPAGSGPSCSGDDCSINFGGSALYWDSEDDSIWAAGFPSSASGGGRIGKFTNLSTMISALTPNNTLYSQMPTLTQTAAGWVDASAGHLNDVDAVNKYVTGIYRAGSDLYLNVTVYFGSSSTFKSLFRVSSDLASPAFISGPQLITGGASGDCGGNNGCKERWIGNFSRIPSALQASFGGHDLITGTCCGPIETTMSSGPTATSFSSSDLNSGAQITGARRFGYPDVSPSNVHTTLGDFYAQGGTGQWNGGDNGWWSPTFIDNTIVVIVSHGQQDNFSYSPAVGTGDIITPIVTVGNNIAVSGAGSTDVSDGTKVNLPNADFTNNGPGTGIPTGLFVHIFGETLPLRTWDGQGVTGGAGKFQHPGVAKVLSYSGSGTGAAQVIVDNAFATNLTGKDIWIGEMTGYNPVIAHGAIAIPASFQHSPNAYPIERHVYLYSAAAVLAAGNYYDAVPYEDFVITLPFKYLQNGDAVAETMGVGPSTWDSSRRKLYFIQTYTNVLADNLLGVIGVSAASEPAPASQPLWALAAMGATFATLSLGNWLPRRRA